MVAAVVVLTTILASYSLVFNHPQFGGKPKGARLARMKKSPNYRTGRFHNLAFTPQLTEGATVPKLMVDMLVTRYPDRRPGKPVPSIRTDLKKIRNDDDVLIWFGHSSYYFQLAGIRFLVDPVLSGNASPIPGSNRSFEGTDIYTADDIPEIDYLLLTHDHYDHADYRTLVELQARIGHAICGLGTGAHLERWGYQADQITELDWYDGMDLRNGIRLHAAPARHFSGRTFKRNTTLWVSFFLEAQGFKMFLGGDSGYGKHFKEIAERYGSPDFAILENGQYDARWKYIHAMPEEALKAGADMKARRMMPVHAGKFSMAGHPWYEPLEKITTVNNSSQDPLNVLTPKIGEPVYLKDETARFDSWWRSIM